MFTGIVEEIGSLKSLHPSGQGMTIEIMAQKVMIGTKIGDSICTDGICLTVSEISAHGFRADLMPETVRRTGFASMKAGSPLNLERAMAADGRFGGHMVSGHIDGTGSIQSRQDQSNATLITIMTEPSITSYIVEKGSIAIDGISLTVVSVNHKSFTVSLIPTTASDTTLLQKRAGDTVNLECDILAKYVEKFVSGNRQSSAITMDLLGENGFL